MKPPKAWGQGQIFAYSGLDGKTDKENGLCGYLCGDQLGIQFKIPMECELLFTDVRFRSLEFTAVTGDYVHALADGEELSLLFLNAYTVIGKVPSKCRIVCHGDILPKGRYLKLLEEDGFFSFAVGTSQKEADERARGGMRSDYTTERKQKLSYYERFYYEGRYEGLYGKCLSVMKTQVNTPEGIIPSLWSTPDRYPHRHLWFWDSVFHAIGFRHVDPVLAETLLLAVFSGQRTDGFIPHMTLLDGVSKITQPPVIAFGALKVYEKSQNKAFLETVFGHNKAFLKWMDKNRRKPGNLLYTWHRSEDQNCRCDESGMDNSTRFDTDSELLAIDLSCFMANEMRYMAEISEILGKEEEKAYYQRRFDEIRREINRLLWNDGEGFYYDYDIDRGCLHNISSVASFLPLFADVADMEQAGKLIEKLTDPNQYGTAFPIPSLPKGSSYFGDDMWRGPVWINFNYMIAEGLHAYGYAELSEEIKRKTLKYVNKYYQETGTVLEFYDSENERPPYLLNRKGPAVFPYNPSVKMQCIRDYGWTATLTFDWLN